jgi:membrane-bound ClpP family serine protease
MMSLAIIALILLGLVLLFLEIFVIPGLTIAGVAAGVSLVMGVYLSFHNYGFWGGIITLTFSSIAGIVLFVYAFNSRTWSEMALQKTIDSKVNTIELDEVLVGDRGRTVSRLAPMGKVQIHDQFYESKSVEGFLDQETEVEVVKIIKGQILVKPIKN